MNILHAKPEHLSQLTPLDEHISEVELASLICQKRVLIAVENGLVCGWLRWNLFWDNTPFMNMLFLTDPHRGKGWGKTLVEKWETEMMQLGYSTIMTSTASDEYAQHFYQKLGYTSIGGFLLPGEPYEMILCKSL